MMIKRFALLGLVLLLAGCETIAFYALRTGNPAVAQVAVIDGYLAVNREPLVVDRKPGQAAVARWTVPGGVIVEDPRDPSGLQVQFLGRVKDYAPRAKGQPLQLVDLKEPDRSQLNQINCRRPEGSRNVIECVFDPKVKPGAYAYKLRVTTAQGALVLDPTVMLDRPPEP